VYIPEWTGAAKLGEVKSSRAKTFGDVASYINSDKEKGDAACIRFLECCQAVSGLFKTRSETMPEQVHIIFNAFRFF